MSRNAGVKLFVECHATRSSHFLERHETPSLREVRSKKKTRDTLKICDFLTSAVGVCVFLENNWEQS